MAALLIASVPGIVSAQVTLPNGTTTLGTGWGKGGKPKPTPTPSPRPSPSPTSTPLASPSPTVSPTPKPDAQQVWKNTGTDFNAGGSWVSGIAPGAGDVAAFSGTEVTQPKLSASVSIAGLYFSGTVTSGYDLTNTSGEALTLTAYGTTIGTEQGNADSVAIGAENTSGTNTIAVPIILAPALNSTSTIYQAGGGTLVINGVISGAGINLTKTGDGTLVLVGANTYSGGTTLNAGTLQLGSSSTGSITNGPVGTGTLTLNGGTLSSDSNTPRNIANPITFGGDVALGGSTNGGTLTFSGAATLTGTRTLTINSFLTFSGAIGESGGSFGLTLLGGSSFVTFSGTSPNTYTGVTTVGDNIRLNLSKSSGVIAIPGDLNINGGTVSLLADNQIASTATITMTGGQFDMASSGPGLNQTIANFSNSGGALVVGCETGSAICSPGHLVVTGTTTWSAGGTNLIDSGATLETPHFVITGGVNHVNALGGSHPSDGTGGMVKILGGGAGLEMTGGTLLLGSDAVAPAILLLDNNVTTFASATTAAISNKDSFAIPGTIDLDGGTRTFTVAAGTTITGTDLSISARIINGALTKAGAGTLALSGPNTYTGVTTVNAGTLFVNGDQTSATGTTTVNNSGTVLGGTGTIGSAVSIASSGAILEGGTGSTGQTLTVKGNVTMSTGSIIELALGSSLSHSTITMSSATLSFATNQDFKFMDLGATTGTYNGIITGVPNPGTTALNSWVIDNSGYSGSFSWESANGGEIDLTLTAVPEPSTWAAAALAMSAFVISQRRTFSRMLKRAWLTPH